MGLSTALLGPICSQTRDFALRAPPVGVRLRAGDFEGRKTRGTVRPVDVGHVGRLIATGKQNLRLVWVSTGSVRWLSITLSSNPLEQLGERPKVPIDGGLRSGPHNRVDQERQS